MSPSVSCACLPDIGHAICSCHVWIVCRVIRLENGLVALLVEDCPRKSKATTVEATEKTEKLTRNRGCSIRRVGNKKSPEVSAVDDVSSMEEDVQVTEEEEEEEMEGEEEGDEEGSGSTADITEVEEVQSEDDSDNFDAEDALVSSFLSCGAEKTFIFISVHPHF